MRRVALGGPARIHSVRTTARRSGRTFDNHPVGASCTARIIRPVSGTIDMNSCALRRDATKRWGRRIGITNCPACQTPARCATGVQCLECAQTAEVPNDDKPWGRSRRAFPNLAGSCPHHIEVVDPKLTILFEPWRRRYSPPHPSKGRKEPKVPGSAGPGRLQGIEIEHQPRFRPRARKPTSLHNMVGSAKYQKKRSASSFFARA